MKRLGMLFLVLVIILAGFVAYPPYGFAEDALLVYSGAGMRKPMDEMGAVFHKKYNTPVKYNYAGSNALLSQMALTKEGDVYMPGETMYFEIAAKKGLVDYRKLTCYHIPIITVPKGNLAHITELSDLTKPGVRLIFGDPKVAAIGKTAVEILKKNGIYEKSWANVIATVPTMNEVMVQIALGQADASINWWDTVKAVKDIEVVEIAKDQNAIKIIPVGITTFSKHPDTAKKFVEFCVSSEGKGIFERHGFVAYPNPKFENAQK